MRKGLRTSSAFFRRPTLVRGFSLSRRTTTKSGGRGEQSISDYRRDRWQIRRAIWSQRPASQGAESSPFLSEHSFEGRVRCRTLSLGVSLFVTFRSPPPPLPPLCVCVCVCVLVRCQNLRFLLRLNVLQQKATKYSAHRTSPTLSGTSSYL